MDGKKILVFGISTEELEKFLSGHPKMKDQIEVVEKAGADVIVANDHKELAFQINEMRINEERFKSPESFKHYARPLSAAGKNPNMPDRQPCPDCKRSCRKIDGRAQGAIYHCPNHSDFFVSTAKYGKERKKL
jgi:hypothetical protein